MLHCIYNQVLASYVLRNKEKLGRNIKENVRDNRGTVDPKRNMLTYIVITSKYSVLEVVVYQKEKSTLMLAV